MIEVGSIMTVNLLISDKPSVSKLCGYRLHSVRPSLDQLDDESATNQIGRSWFWGALSGVPSFTFPVWGGTGVYMQEAHVHAGTEEALCPLVQDQWRLYLMEWVLQKIHTGMRRHNHGLSYYFDHTESDLVSINPIGEIKFSIGDGDEVRHNKISIIKLMRW